ncbi:MAG: response regulator [Myxococcota bacterium]
MASDPPFGTAVSDPRALFGAALELADEIILLVEPDGRVAWASPSWERVTGHPSAAILGQPFDRHIPSFDRHIVALSGDSPAAHRPGEHFFMRHRSGTPMNFAGRGRWFEQDGVRRHLLVWRDATQEDAYSDAIVLFSQTQPFREIVTPILRGAGVRLNHGLFWIQWLEADGRLKNLSAPHLPAGWLEIADGFEPTDPAGPTCLPTGGEKVAIRDFKGEHASHPLAAKARALGIDGVWSIPLRGSSGALVGVASVLCPGELEPTPERLEILTVISGVAWLLGERDRAGRDLQRAHSQLTFHMDNSPLASVELDRAFRVVRWSPNTTRMLGWQIEEIQALGAGVIGLFDEQDRPELLQMIASLQSGNSKRGVVSARIRAKDGRIIQTEWHISALREGSGDTVSFMALGQDVSARRHREEQILRTQKWESLGVLTGGIAHDFNNLLTAILGHSELAALVLPEDSAARGHLEHVQSASERASRLMQQLLHFSGRGILHAEHLDLNRVVLDMPDLLAVPLSKAARISYELTADPLIVEADEEQLRQLVLSLVTNACEALRDDGGGNVVVSTSLVTLNADDVADVVDRDVKPGSFVLLEVRDDGVGMTPEVLARAFDPFFTTKEIGRGLGLAALTGILRGLGGIERVQTAPGEGTIFRAYIPASRLLADRATAAPPEPVPTMPDSFGKVLVADDDDTVREFLAEVLLGEGYEVESASDGAGALAILRGRTDSFGLVILDRSMDGMDGTEALPKIRALEPALPVLVTSGHDLEDLRHQFGATQPDAFLLKPFRPRDLIEQVAAVRRKV